MRNFHCNKEQVATTPDKNTVARNILFSYNIMSPPPTRKYSTNRYVAITSRAVYVTNVYHLQYLSMRYIWVQFSDLFKGALLIAQPMAVASVV
jgi:hypothetical protein